MRELPKPGEPGFSATLHGQRERRIERDPNAYVAINTAFARLPYSAHCIETIFATHDDEAARGIILANLQRVAEALRAVGEREAANEKSAQVARALMVEATDLIAELRQKRDQAHQAMQRFVDRVDAGEVRSTTTYNEFKEILKHGR